MSASSVFGLNFDNACMVTAVYIQDNVLSIPLSPICWIYCDPGLETLQAIQAWAALFAAHAPMSPTSRMSRLDLMVASVPLTPSHQADDQRYASHQMSHLMVPATKWLETHWMPPHFVADF